MAASERADVILVGGGLANSLIALRLRVRRPRLKVLMLERAAVANDAQTWSFFESDVPPAVASWLQPLAAHRWRGYRVQFPGYARDLTTAYSALTAGGLARCVEAALGADLRRGVAVHEVGPQAVTDQEGRRYEAPLVIDGRGARGGGALQLAWQKFVGLELRTEQPHGVERPLVMDATPPQRDGYRFLYVLPLAPDRLLVEDTRYSDGAELDDAALEEQVLAYARDHGWSPAEVVRRERGVLPIVLGGDIDAFWAERPDDVPCAGMNAALFHPTTGYSLPDAAQLADELACAPVLESVVIAAEIRRRSRRLWRERGYFHALNRMMFIAAAPEQRYRVLQRFYRLPEPLIRRFYAARLTWADQARILLGEPPVPILRALAALSPGSASERRFHAA